MQRAYILASYRTPGCRASKGKFKTMRPDDLAGQAIRGLIDRTGIDPTRVDDVYLGCSFPEGEQGLNVGRLAWLRAGLPAEVPGQTINRFCASGLQAIASAAERVMVGMADCIVAGGVESMTCVPIGGRRFSANPHLAATWPEAYTSMGLTAELVAEQYGIDRQAMDSFAAASHAKAAAAAKAGRFDDEIIPVQVHSEHLVGSTLKQTEETVCLDDGIRPDTTTETLARLKPVFRNNGSVTAGNSSQMTDGAAVSLVVSESFLRQSKQEPLARFLGYAVRGVAPEVMGIGPIAAIPALLNRLDIDLGQIELIELNEAFAAQALAVIQTLKLDPKLVNVNGGAIALGHPLGCTGAKLTATLLNEMRRRSARYGLVSMCIGGGMGAAALIERQ